MKTKILLISGLAFALAGAVTFAQANSNSRGPEGNGCIPSSDLGPDGEWRCLDWPEGGGDEAPAGVVVSAVPIFLSGPYKIELTDAFCAGDIFQVRVDGVVIGSTSSVPNESDCLPTCGSDYDACFANSDISSGTFYLGPGTHTVEIEVTQDPFGYGSGAIRATAQPAQAIPTMGAWGLAALVVALAGASFLLLRRRRAA